MSHRGIADLTNVSRLWAYGVDQDFLDEICAMHALDSLYLERVTANDLSGLSKLERLRHLSVIDATKIESLEWIPVRSRLESLALENLARVRDLGSLAPLPALRSLAVEGSMWTPMRAPTLQPLSRLTSLEAIFLTSLRVADGSLEPLHTLPRLQVLQCARFFARGGVPTTRGIPAGASLPMVRRPVVAIAKRRRPARAGPRSAVASPADRGYAER